MNSNRVKNRLAAAGTAACRVPGCPLPSALRTACVALGLVLLMGCESQPSPSPSQPAQPAPATAPSPQPAVNRRRPAAPRAADGAEEGRGGRGQEGPRLRPGRRRHARRQLVRRPRNAWSSRSRFPMRWTSSRPPKAVAPKDNDEFMQRIIKENHIKLPELPEGDRYMYDPKTEQLMVESPEPE